MRDAARRRKLRHKLEVATFRYESAEKKLALARRSNDALRSMYASESARVHDLELLLAKQSYRRAAKEEPNGTR